MGYGLDLVAGEIEDEEILRPTALVALPVAEVAEERRVHHLRYRRARNRRRRSWASAAPLAARRCAAPCRACFHRAARIPQRAEEHLFAIRGPAVDLVVVAPARRQRAHRRVPGEPGRLSTGRRHHVDLLVTVVLTGEGDPLAIRRELAEQLLTRMCGQPAGHSAVGGRHPQVTAIAEDHLVPMDIREPQEPGSFLGLDAGGRQQKAQKASDHSCFHFDSPSVKSGPRRRQPDRAGRVYGVPSTWFSSPFFGRDETEGINSVGLISAVDPEV